MMTKEEIIDLAEQSGFLFDDGFPIGFTYSMLKDFAKLIAEKKREECAKIIDAEAKETGLCAYYANLIRTRGQQ